MNNFILIFIENFIRQIRKSSIATTFSQIKEKAPRKCRCLAPQRIYISFLHQHSRDPDASFCVNFFCQQFLKS